MKCSDNEGGVMQQKSVHRDAGIEGTHLKASTLQSWPSQMGALSQL